MACCGFANTGKADKEKSKLGACAVCVGLRNDHSVKVVYYCYLCNEWICKPCEPKIIDRGFAALKKLFTFK